MYSKEQIKSIIKGIDLISLISGYIQLKKKGKNYLGLCPFHQEKTPSFNVDPIKNFYHCFGCGKHGDALQFLMEYNNFSFLEALEQLALNQGITLQQNKRNFRPTRKILEIAQEFFQKNTQILPADVKEYLQNRNLLSENLKNFEIGYAPNSWNALKNTLEKKIFAEAVQVGILKKSEKTENYYDFFRHRIMFPFRDIQGALVGFAGRSIGEQNPPKYLNSPEFELFQKNSFFYGLFQAKKAIYQKRRIIIVEGYIDVIRMSEKGIAEVISIAGSSITPKHIYALKQKGVEIIFLFDGDSAGNKAAIKAASLALSYGLDAKIANLPNNSDPDSFLQDNNIEQMETLLQDAKNIFPYLLNETKILYQNTTSLIEKDKIVEDLVHIGNTIENDRKKNIFFLEAQKYLGINKYFFQSKNVSNLEIENKSILIIETIEIKLIQASLQQLKYFSLIKKYLLPSDFLNPIIQKFLQRLFCINENLQTIGFLALLQIFRDDTKIKDFLLSCEKKETLQQPQGQLEQWIYKIKKKSIYRNYEIKFIVTKQKEAWQECKKQLKAIEHLDANPVYQRNARFTTLSN